MFTDYAKITAEEKVAMVQFHLEEKSMLLLVVLMEEMVEKAEMCTLR